MYSEPAGFLEGLTLTDEHLVMGAQGLSGRHAGRSMHVVAGHVTATTDVKLVTNRALLIAQLRTCGLGHMPLAEVLDSLCVLHD